MAIQLTACGVYLVLGFLLCRKVWAGNQGRRLQGPWPLVLLFGGALLLRLVLGAAFTGYETDMNTFKAWAGLVDSLGMNQIYYSDVFLDYPPGYLYILWFLEKLRQLLGLDAAGSGFTLLIKLPSILADLACGWLLYRLTEKRPALTWAHWRRGSISSARRCSSTAPFGARRTVSACCSCWGPCCSCSGKSPAGWPLPGPSTAWACS